MNFRKSTFNDLEPIKELYTYAMNKMSRDNSEQWTFDTVRIEDFTNFIDKTLYVLEDNNKIVGLGMINNIVDDYFLNFVKDNEVRFFIRKVIAYPGYGKTTLRYLVSEGFKTHKICYIDTHDHNYAMQKCIKKLGFNYIGSNQRKGKKYPSLCYDLLKENFDEAI